MSRAGSDREHRNFGVDHGSARALKLLYMQTHEVSMLHRVTQLGQP